MSVLLGIFFWLLLVILGLVGLVLITPVFLRVHVTNSPLLAYRVEIIALGGLAPRLLLAHGPRQDTVGAHKAKQAKSRHRRSLPPRRVRGALIRALPELVKDILRHIHLSELHIDADYGLGDPADTGLLSGLLMPLQYANPLPQSVLLDLRPDFTGVCLKGSMSADVRVTAVAFLFPVLRFAWRAFGPVK